MKARKIIKMNQLFWWSTSLLISRKVAKTLLSWSCSRLRSSTNTYLLDIVITCFVKLEIDQSSTSQLPKEFFIFRCCAFSFILSNFPNNSVSFLLAFDWWTVVRKVFNRWRWETSCYVRMAEDRFNVWACYFFCNCSCFQAPRGLSTWVMYYF